MPPEDFTNPAPPGIEPWPDEEPTLPDPEGVPCPKCRGMYDVSRDGRFCPHCGMAVGWKAAPAPPELRERCPQCAHPIPPGAVRCGAGRAAPASPTPLL